MRRWAFNIVSALSLLVMVAVGVLWAGSRWHGQQVFLIGPGGRCCLIGSYRDNMLVEVETGWPAWGRAPWHTSSAQGLKPVRHVTDPSPAGGTSHKARWWRLGSQTGTHSVPFHPDGSALSSRESLEGSREAALRYGLVFFPHWPAILAFSLLPALWATRRLWRWRSRRHRLRHGLCLTCGYDLRASPERCPECGTPVAAKGAT